MKSLIKSSHVDLAQINKLPYEEKLRLLELLKEKQRREQYNKIVELFPDKGEFKRDLYKKHLEFFKAGAYHTERLFMAGNRVGKTEAGGAELTYHLTGEYPHWWEGKRFDRPVNALAAGDSTQTTRDIIQKKLVGGKWGEKEWGTGLIPGKCLDRKPALKSGVSNAYETIYVKHISGGYSVLKLRTYEQGRKIFQGTEEDIVWMDEECPYDVYEEALIRTMTTNGIFILTFTPLSGLTELVQAFIKTCKGIKIGEDNPRYMVQAGWNDAPHLSEEQKQRLIKSLKLKPHQLRARQEGEPSLGSGAIYPYDPEEIKVKPFIIPKHWDKAYGLDVGWNRTAVIWGAWDRDNDIVYLYSEHYMGQVTAAEHTAAIKARGDWILGTIDPASRGRSQTDGKKLHEQYVQGGLSLVLADNAVEAGLLAVNERLATGRLKVFGNLNNWFSEYALYRRDDKGQVVKENDHLMDAMRYLIMMLIRIMTKPPIQGSVRVRPVGDWRAG